MSDPTDDLFGPVPAVKPPADPAIPDIPANSGARRKEAKAKAPAKPARRLVAPVPPAEPKVYEPIPMGHEGKSVAEQRPEEPPKPRYKRRRLAALAPCDCCDRPSTCDEEFVIERDFHPEQVVRVCKPCRTSTGADFPRGAWLAGPLAGPWCVALLREAGRLPYEPRRGHL